MIRLDQYRERTFSLTITSDDHGELNVVYLPAAVAKQINALTGLEGQPLIVGVYKALLTSLTWWDMYQSEGKTLALTARGVGRLPLPLAMWIWSSIVADMLARSSNPLPSRVAE